MKLICCILAFLPLNLFAQRPDTLGDSHKKLIPEAFVSGGAVSELWVVTDKVPYGYSSFTYNGRGAYIGGGVKTKERPGHLFSYGLTLDYLGYKMAKTLNDNEHVQLSYGFARVAPSVYVLLKKRPLISYHAIGSVAYMGPLKNHEHGYFQLGLKVTASYKAYDLVAGFNYGSGNTNPGFVANTNSWHEQMLTIGVVCYPGMLLPKKPVRKSSLFVAPAKK